MPRPFSSWRDFLPASPRYPAPQRPGAAAGGLSGAGGEQARSRLEVAGSTGFTPLVGREQEIGLLLERWAQVKDGFGQVVLLSGEAGIGKSRLVQALKEHVARAAGVADAVPLLALSPAQCPVSGDRSPAAAAALRAGGAPEQKLGKLEGLLVQYGLPLAEMCRCLPPCSRCRCPRTIRPCT